MTEELPSRGAGVLAGVASIALVGLLLFGIVWYGFAWDVHQRI